MVNTIALAVLIFLALCLCAVIGMLAGSDLMAKRRRARKPGCINDPWCGYLRNPLCPVCAAEARGAEILDVAAQGLDAAPELADDSEAAGRTVFALEEVARLRALAAADGQHAAEPNALLVEIYNAQTRYRFKNIYGEDGQP